MPEQEDGLLWGFQLWVNLPAADKMTAPAYQDMQPEQIGVVERPDGVRIKVIAGVVEGVEGAVSSAATDPTYLDIALPAGTGFEHSLPAGHSAFVYVFEGSVDIGGGKTPGNVDRGELAVLTPGDRVALANSITDQARLLLVAGKPLGEPISRHGPFVMNSDREIRQAIEDFRAGRF
jgi:redox-sensitive bicupin YhaK (pirin superfamily)